MLYNLHSEGVWTNTRRTNWTNIFAKVSQDGRTCHHLHLGRAVPNWSPCAGNIHGQINAPAEVFLPALIRIFRAATTVSPFSFPNEETQQGKLVNKSKTISYWCRRGLFLSKGNFYFDIIVPLATPARFHRVETLRNIRGALTVP